MNWLTRLTTWVENTLGDLWSTSSGMNSLVDTYIYGSTKHITRLVCCIHDSLRKGMFSRIISGNVKCETICLMLFILLTFTIGLCEE